MKFLAKLPFVLILASLFLPLFVAAHEVYVLTPAEISQALKIVSPNPLTAIPAQEKLFLLCGILGALLVLGVLAFSISPLFEKIFDPFLFKLKRYAPLVGRVTLGLSIFASGYYHASFGPELPLSNLTHASGALSYGLMGLGILIVFNFLTRWAALGGILFFTFLAFKYQFYMLNYLNYLGEMVLVFVISGGVKALEKYSFLILRVCFGASLFFASFYAKFSHSNLALDTIRDYHLTNYFHFTPLFLVLGAFIIEALLGLCFIFGFEIRFAAIFFTFFLTLSLLFFGEVVWPHVILFGVNLALFCHGYDKYTLEKALFQRHRAGEPVL